MSEQFKDQGGVATSNPSRLVRWATSRVMSKLFTDQSMAKKRRAAEATRQQEGRPASG